MNSWLIGLAALVSVSQISFAASLTASTGDEGTCIHQLARKVVDDTAWSHLILDDIVYFRDPLYDNRTYTLFAISRTNSPKNYKIQFKATWIRGQDSKCTLDSPAVVTSGAGDKIAEWNFEGRKDILDPARFPLRDAEDTTREDFFEEKSFAGKPKGELRRKDPSVDFDAQTLDMLKQQSLYFVGEVAVAHAAGWLKPTSRGLKFVKRIGRATLYVDAAARVYLVMTGDPDPGTIAVGKFIVRDVPKFLKKVDNATTEKGMLRVPKSYNDQFYRRP